MYEFIYLYIFIYLYSHTYIIRELRHIDSNLRKENTELKHRLRQLESRSGSASGNPASSSGVTENQIIVKIRRQNDALQRELTEMTNAYERLKYVTSNEIAKWKNLAQSSALSNASMNTLPSSSGSHRMSSKYKTSSTASHGKTMEGVNSKSSSKSTLVKGQYVGGSASRSRSASPSSSTKYYHYNGKTSSSSKPGFDSSKRVSGSTQRR